jgi:hypothetical protein
MDSKQLQKIINEEFDKFLQEAESDPETSIIDNVFDKIGKASNWLKSARIRKGGKFLNKKETQAAIEQVNKILSDSSQKAISDLDKELKDKFEGFPNNRNLEDFLGGIVAIELTYEGIKKQVEAGEITDYEANVIIVNLRRYIQKLIDYDLGEYYVKFLKEADETEADREFEAGAGKTGQEGPLTGTKETETGKVLKSTLLPKVMVFGGLGGLVASSEWFQDLLSSPDVTPDEAGEAVERVTQTIEDGEGITQTMGRGLGNNPNFFSPATPATVFFDTVETAGISPTDSGGLVDAAANPTAFREAYAEIPSIMEKNPNATLSDIFGQNSAFFLKKSAGIQLARAIPKMAAAGAVATGASAATAAAIASALTGITALAGAALYASRKKGLKTSRFASLQELLNTLDLLQSEEPLTPIEKEIRIKSLADGKPIVAGLLGAGEPRTALAPYVRGEMEIYNSPGVDVKIGAVLDDEKDEKEPDQLGFGKEIRKAIEAGEGPKAISPGDLKAALAAGTKPLALAPGQITRSIGAGESIPGDTGFTTPDGIPIVVGGIYNYTKNPKRKVFQYLSRDAAKKAATSRDELEEGPVSSGTVQPGEKTFIKITKIDTKGSKPQFYWVEVDPSTGKVKGKEQAPFSNLAKLGMPLDIADNPVARFARVNKKQKIDNEDAAQINGLLNAIINNRLSKGGNPKRLKRHLYKLYNFVVANTSQGKEDYYEFVKQQADKKNLGKAKKDFLAGATEPGAKTLEINENNIVEALRELKKEKLPGIDENKINKLESVLKEHKQKLIEEQKIHNYWKKHAGLLKG